MMMMMMMMKRMMMIRRRNLVAALSRSPSNIPSNSSWHLRHNGDDGENIDGDGDHNDADGDDDDDAILKIHLKSLTPYSIFQRKLGKLFWWIMWWWCWWQRQQFYHRMRPMLKNILLYLRCWKGIKDCWGNWKNFSSFSMPVQQTHKIRNCWPIFWYV